MDSETKKRQEQSQKERLRELALFAPNFAKLVFRLLKDPRTPLRAKAGLVFLGGYLACPIDLIPDFIPVIGYADDVVIIALSLGWIVRTAGEELVREHWDGAEDPTAVTNRVRAAVGEALPRLGRLWKK